VVGKKNPAGPIETTDFPSHMYIIILSSNIGSNKMTLMYTIEVLKSIVSIVKSTYELPCIKYNPFFLISA